MLRLERLRQDIQELSRRVIERQRRNAAELKTIRRWFDAAPAAHVIREQVTSAQRTDRVAQPVTDAPVGAQFTSNPSPPPNTVVIGVDGSQIPPDHHATVLYYVLQVGGLIFHYNGEAPFPHTETRLYFEEADLYDAEGLLITTQLGMRRTVAELEFLADLVESERRRTPDTPILALTDGPLLWPYRPGDEANRSRDAYLAVFDRLQAAGGILAGFVERPGGRYVVEMARVSQAAGDMASAYDGIEAPGHLDDQALMAEMLAPGARSPWFARLSETNDIQARRGHEIRFCYLNVGETGYPVVARIDAPSWVVEDAGTISLLHAALQHQTRVLHGNPYVLARAHELALVTSQDKALLESVLHRALMEQGIVARPSEKARQKAYLSRRR
ncbi:MAG: DNA double-strand break repair nuclease NurA [Anaerolineae bacterium]|nr:DNA double-strand break repair nuclease NurA [Anaerolineae bacterium]